MLINLYTDGACSGNPGPGGWGCVLVANLPTGEHYEKQHSAGYKCTTNNRMELMAVIEGLKAINGSHDVTITSDSSYVCDAFNKGWLDNWIANGWKRGKNEDVANVDLWKELVALLDTQYSVEFVWVRGHNGHHYNEICDKLAVAAYNDTENLKEDIGFNKSL